MALSMVAALLEFACSSSSNVSCNALSPWRSCLPQAPIQDVIETVVTVPMCRFFVPHCATLVASEPSPIYQEQLEQSEEGTQWETISLCVPSSSIKMLLEYQYLLVLQMYRTLYSANCTDLHLLLSTHKE